MRRVLWAAIATSAAALSFAGAASAKTATIGSTSGTPESTGPGACFSACTNVPFSNVSAPSLVVPFDGNVTSYSVNEGSTGSNTLKLRVLRPASGGQFTAIFTSSAHTTTGTLETIPVSLPVKKGDVLGLDTTNSAIVFDNSSTTPIDAYYAPPIADGSTASPTTATGFRLLMSAVIQSTGSTPLPPGTTPPKISGARLTHKRFRLAKGKTLVSAKAPRGTTFKFTLSNAANVQIVIARLVPGRRKGGRCVKPTHKLRSAHAKRCLRSARVGQLTRTNLAQGAATIKFTGRLGSKALKTARYSATLTATNSAGRSKAVTLRFRVVRK